MVLIGFDLSLDLIAKNMKEIYRQDSLTGLLNRNAYDSDVEQLRSADIGAVVCVYADMIGLHEVNNHLGHKQGNRMLCEFADAARAFFGDDRLYRIGGDEFVIISSAHTEAQTRKQLNYMRERLHTQGCEISSGRSVERVDFRSAENHRTGRKRDAPRKEGILRARRQQTPAARAQQKT